MRKFFGTIGVLIGALAFIGTAGGITELGPQAGINDVLSIISTLLVSGCLVSLGIHMVREDL